MKTLIRRNSEEGTLEVRMNRPDRLNALNPALIADLITLFRGLQHDRKTRVVILTGAGKGFCADADLQAQAGQERCRVPKACRSSDLCTSTRNTWRN